MALGNHVVPAERTSGGRVAPAHDDDHADNLRKVKKRGNEEGNLAGPSGV
jgi:hypothetical protein